MGCKGYYCNPHILLLNTITCSICQTYVQLSDDFILSQHLMARRGLIFAIIPLLILMVQAISDSTLFDLEVQTLKNSIRTRLEKLPNYNTSSVTSVERRRQLVQLYKQKLQELKDNHETEQSSTEDITHRTCYVLPVDVQFYGKLHVDEFG